MGKWIFIAILGSMWPAALAQVEKSPPLSLDDPYSLKWAAMDNPAGLRAWARQKLSTLDPKQQGRLWAQALATYFHEREMGLNDDEQRVLLNQALKLVQEVTVPADVLYTLKSTQMEFQIIEQYGVGAVLPPDVRDAQFQEKIRLAEQLNLPSRRAEMKLEWGQFMLESGRDGDGVKKMYEAIRELQKTTNVSELEIMRAKEFYAAALLSLQATEKAKLIYSDLERFCEIRKPRYFCVIVDSDYAYLMSNAKDPALYPEAFKALSRALASAEALEDEISIASVSNSMLRLLDTMGRHEEALKHGLRAIAIFQRQNNGVWLGDTQRKLSSVYLNLNQPQKALELLAIARKTFPEEYHLDHTQISLQEARAYKALNQYQKAYLAMNAYAKALRANASRNQNAEIAQNLTQVNLELEEEHSRSLTQAEHLQKIQAELDAMNRMEQERTLQLINIISIASGFLITSGIFGLIWIRQQNKRIIRLNRHLREDVLQRFLPPIIAERVANGQAVLDETPHEQNVTALFGRLVGLEHAIEDLGPRVTARLLESLMQAVTDVSMEHRGCLDKLHRGSFLILFGAPLTCSPEQQVQDALGFAHAIQRRFEQISESWPSVEGWRPGLAIGIHCGPALVGVFGGKRRADYTAVGQTVNLAARIEGEAKSGEILISEKVASMLGEGQCRPLGEVRLKGISKAQNLFSVEAAQAVQSAS